MINIQLSLDRRGGRDTNFRQYLIENFKFTSLTLSSSVQSGEIKRHTSICSIHQIVIEKVDTIFTDYKLFMNSR